MVATKLSVLLKAVPLDRLSPAGERCRVATEWGAGGIAAGDDGRGVCYRQESFLIKPKPPCRGLRGGFGHRKENNMKKQKKSG